MSELNVNLGNINNVKLQAYNGVDNYPTGLGSTDAGYLIFDSAKNTLAFWSGSEWRQALSSGNEDGLAPSTAIINFTNWLTSNPSSGEYWVKPDSRFHCRKSFC